MTSQQQEMIRWALNREWGAKEARGEESPDGATRFLLHPQPYAVQRKLNRQEASGEGGPGLTE